MAVEQLPTELKKEYPFKQHFLNVKGDHKLHYVDEGEGPAMLMVHGNPTWSFYYRNLIKHFSKDHRVLAPDHIGCGLSHKPQQYDYTLKNHINNLENLVLSLKLKKITLIIHDWGGAIGMGVATKHPHLFKKIIILNTAAFTSNRIPMRINICKFPLFGEKLIRTFNAFALPATFMAVKRPLNKAVKLGYLFPYNNYKNRVATAKFVQDIPMNKSHPSWETLKGVENNLHKLKIPKIILWGGLDFCFNQSFLERWQEIYPDAKVHIYEKAGHYVLEDAGDNITQKIEDFIQ